MAVDRWRHYLQRRKFEIRTDHKALSFLGSQELHSELQRKAMEKLMGMQFKVIYKQGKENKVADALSRVGCVMALTAVSEVQPRWIQEVTNSYVTDSDAQSLLARLCVHSSDEYGYSLSQGVIRKGSLIWVGQNSALRTKLVATLHDSATGGHSGVHATYHRLKKLVFWKGMNTDVEDFVKQCQICQKAKGERVHPTSLLQPLPVPQGAWQDIAMDFIEKLPKSSGYDTILDVVDCFSKYAHFIALKHPFTAAQVAQVVLDQVVRLHSLPRSIVSDRDKIFTNIFWSQLFKLLGTKLNLSTTYHPQTDGQSERVNQCVEMYLRCAVHAQPSKWKNWLPLAEFWYNTTYHTSLACSPFKVLYGYDPPFAAAPHIPSDAIVDVAQLLEERAQFTLMLREQLAVAENRNKLKADRLRTERQFNVSDMVLLKLQPYTQHTVVSRSCPKLAFKFFGPYKILERVGAVAYRLELPIGAQVHPVFHVSQLKPYILDYTLVFATLPTSSDLSGHNVHPLEILNRRLIKKGNRAVPQVLIRWSHVPAEQQPGKITMFCASAIRMLLLGAKQALQGGRCHASGCHNAEYKEQGSGARS
jgi:hypothetical protein